MDGDELQSFETYSNEVYSVSFSPDGKTLASAGDDGTVKLWNLDGDELQSFEGHSAWVSNISFSPDGKTLASADGNGIVKLWNLDGDELQSFEGHSAWVSNISFSPDGKTLASASGDGTVKLWNLDGDELQSFEGHNSRVNSVSFSPDGKTLVSADENGTIRIWNLDREDLVQKSCDWLNDYLITHPNILLDLMVCHTPERRQAAALYLVQKATQTASKGATEAAEQQLNMALTWNPEVDLDPNTSESEQDAAQIALKFTAPYHRHKAQRLANQLKIAEAIQAYNEALALDPTIDLDPETKAVEQDPAQVTQRFAALGQRQRGQRRIRELKTEAAIQSFEEALKLDPNIDLNPDTEQIEQDPKAVTRKLSALSKVLEGQRKVRKGQVQEAIQAYQVAQEFDPDLEITAWDWNALCWDGSLHNYAADVLFACEKAVALAPDNGNIIDSRGLARALTGDIEGAIQDFQTFVDRTSDEEAKAQRQRWIDALRTGENPFTEEELEQLR